MGKKSSTYNKLLKAWTKFDNAINRFNHQADKKGWDTKIAMYAILGNRDTAERAVKEFKKLDAVLGFRSEEESYGRAYIPDPK